MSSYLELEFLYIELVFSHQARARSCLRDLTIDEADSVHACDKILSQP